MVLAGDAIESLFRGFGPLGGIPDKVWSDPYAMGWISGYALGSATIFALAHRDSIDRLDNVEQGQIMFAGWERVTPQNRHAEVLRRLGTLAKSNDPDYARGYDAATKIVLYDAGMLGDHTDLEIADAEATAKSLAEDGLYEFSRSSVTRTLIAQRFFQVFVSTP